MAEKVYYVMLGNFGSGKTELALHFATAFAQDGQAVTVADLDIINPYFRAAERADLLREQGIELIAPRFAISNVEIITIDPRIYSVFAPGSGAVIFDVGGDNIGARALGQYWPNFQRLRPEQLHVWLVVNPFRPLSDSAERITALLEKIEEASRLKVEGLINNSNLSIETTAEELRQGYDIVRQTADMTGLPVLYTSGQQPALADFLALAKSEGLEQRYIGQPLPIETRMHRDWQRFTKYGV